MESTHIPVLLNEALELLRPLPNQNFIDATFGAGGHSVAILDATAPAGQLIAIDRDPMAVSRARSLGSRVHAVCENFYLIEDIVRNDFPELIINGIFFDLGISSIQLDDASLGLSFQIEGPLDMRLERKGFMTAASIINSWPEKALTDLLRNYGEESNARRIVAAIVRTRKSSLIETTTQLTRIITEVIPVRAWKIHPATKTFQALRIAVNEEFENLRKGLAGALKIVARGGRVAVITFHSLEDRIVKQMFREAARICVCSPEALRCECLRVAKFQILTKKPIVPSDQEVAENPRSRSAKLRVIQKISYD